MAIKLSRMKKMCFLFQKERRFDPRAVSCIAAYPQGNGNAIPDTAHGLEWGCFGGNFFFFFRIPDNPFNLHLLAPTTATLQQAAFY